MATLNTPVTTTKGNVKHSYSQTGISESDLWDVCHDGAGNGSGADIKAGWTEGSSWNLELYRGYMQFNTSSLAGATILSAKIKLTGTQYWRNTIDSIHIGSASSSSYADLKTTTDFGTLPAQGSGYGTSQSSFTDTEVVLNSAGIAAINKTGYTLFSLRGNGDTTDIFTNSADSYDRTIITGATLIVDYTPAPIAPTVTTQAASSIGKTGATLNGDITDTGGENATEEGFYWLQGITGTPTAADNTTSATGDFGIGSFTEVLTGLTANTTYRAVAFATNPAGTSTGTVIQFTTDPAPTVPTVTTQDATSIQETQATLNGTVTDDGDETNTEQGFYLASGSVIPTSSDTVIKQTGSYSVGSFSLFTTGLTDGTLYSVRAFSTNSIGTSTGSVIEFTTRATPKPKKRSNYFFSLFN